ncbi:MAG: hypothetical protein R3E84_18730 [Pseudomonadales bacterium]
MVLSQFLLLQLGVCLLGTLVVYALHALRLRREGRLALEAWTRASEELAEASTDAAHAAWLGEKAKAIDPKEPIAKVRKVVLQCEASDPKTLKAQLQPLILPATLTEDWGKSRDAHANAISALLLEHPRRAADGAATFALYEAIDKGARLQAARAAANSRGRRRRRG